MLQKRLPLVFQLEEEVDNTAYIELSKKAGFAGCKAVLETVDAKRVQIAFRTFLAENGICRYDCIEVEEYLKTKLPKGKEWVWLPLALGQARKFDPTAKTWPEIGGGKTFYTKAIPAPVLMTVAKVREAFPETVFYVNDIV